MWGNDNRNGPNQDIMARLQALFQGLQARHPGLNDGLARAAEHFPWITRLQGAMNMPPPPAGAAPPPAPPAPPDPRGWMAKLAGGQWSPGDGRPPWAKGPGEGGDEPGGGSPERPRGWDQGSAWWKTGPTAKPPGQSTPRTTKPPRT